MLNQLPKAAPVGVLPAAPVEHCVGHAAGFVLCTCGNITAVPCCPLAPCQGSVVAEGPDLWWLRPACTSGCCAALPVCGSALQFSKVFKYMFNFSKPMFNIFPINQGT